MLKNLPKELESKQKEIKEFYSENSSFLEDIVLYGSVVRGSEPRDLDLLLLLNERKRDKDLSYRLKRIIEKEGIEVDIREKRLRGIFDPNFLPGGSIVLEGYSLISDEFLAEKLNIKNYTLFKYGLENMDRNMKTKYNYALKGREDSKGVLEELGGEHLSSGTVLVPIPKTEEFKGFLERWGIDYEEYRLGMKPVL